MALTILNEQYPPRKPKLTLTADSLDELPTEGVAEGSTAAVGGTVYSYDSNSGWIVPGEGGGGSGGGGSMLVTMTVADGYATLDKTWNEIKATIESGVIPALLTDQSDETVTFYKQLTSITEIWYPDQTHQEDPYCVYSPGADMTFYSSSADGVLSYRL